MGNIGRAVEESVDAMAAVRLDNAQVLCFGMFFDDIAEVLDGDAGFDMSDCLFETLPRRFNEPDIVRVGAGFVPYVVRLVEIAVIAFMEEGYVEVEDVAVLEDSLVRNAVAYDFVDGCAE